MRFISLLFLGICLFSFSTLHAQPGYELRNFVASNPLGVAVGDFDNDGFLDIAISDEQILFMGMHAQQVFLGDGSGNFTRVFSVQAPSAAHMDLTVGDFDLDDFLDIVKPVGQNFPLRTQVIAMKGNGDGTFTFWDNDSTLTDWPNWIASADFDRDGLLDVAVAATTINSMVLPGQNKVSVLLGNGGLNFAVADTFTVGHRPRDIIARDFNGDRYPDLAVPLSRDDAVSIYLGVGDGTFQLPPFTYAVADSPVAVVSGFLDGDVIPDIAVVNNKSESVSVLLGVGNGQFTVVGSTFAVGTNPVSIAEGPLGGDGAHDLAVANRGSDDVTLLIGAGNGTFGTSYTYGVAPGPRAITSADFNGDQLLDLAITCQTAPGSDDSVSVLLRLPTPPTDIGDGPVPSTFGLHANYPNPFNPTTTLRYDVPASGGFVDVAIYNVAGQKVRQLVDEFKHGGVHEAKWDGTDEVGTSVSSGVYFVRMRANGFSAVRKSVLLK